MTSRTCISERLRLPVISTVAVSILALTGCSGGGDPQAGPTASVVASPAQSASGSASATPSSTATAKPKPVYKPADAKGRAQNVPVPVKPPLADKNTKEGLEAFAKYWFALLNYGFETGDLSPIRSITGASCAMCGKIFPGVVKWNSSGRWVEGASIKVQAAQSKFVEVVPGQLQVAIQSEQEAGTLRNADGSVGQKVAPSGVLGDLMIAEYVKGKWHALNVDRLGG
ncbi:hypothetical protein QFZ23_001143 [Arthrobacter globiformis]|uniref:DUF6318 family protein n=1 Tax=Arthrobacter globiformis TaxID=1665 RepID=UPI00277F5A28|nr:DUF6318 family protein [Arthrobacter globiformis]MDQ1057242.1 hypothetical protein [Arthrobacter globiformis]